ncbi:MAG: hypothetical protein GX327_00620 [Epulopiscium sp.]|nr:hypothetical protein [Candidatus Epulonipiscium sp.]
MRKRRKNKKFFQIGWNTILLSIFFIMIAFKTYDLQKINRQLEEQKKGYIEKIEEENQEHAKLLEQKEYSQSDMYIEKVAREKLGLVKEDEIVFMEKSEDSY